MIGSIFFFEDALLSYKSKGVTHTPCGWNCTGITEQDTAIHNVCNGLWSDTGEGVGHGYYENELPETDPEAAHTVYEFEESGL